MMGNNCDMATDNGIGKKSVNGNWFAIRSIGFIGLWLNQITCIAIHARRKACAIMSKTLQAM